MKKLFYYFWSKLLILTKRVDYIPTNINSFPDCTKLASNKIYIVGHENFPKWVVMQCPCGCREQLTLSLMEKHRPNWKINTENNKITLSPSVWKADGCKSHFFIRNGKVIWAKS